MKMLKCLLLSVLMALPATMNAEESLILQKKDGSTVAFAFSAKPRIITAETLQLVSTAGTVEYAFDEVQNFHWADPATTGINGVKAGEKADVTFHITADGITATGLAAGDRVAVYTVDGAQVAAATAQGGTVEVKLEGNNRVYIVKAAGVSYKFIKK